MKNAPLDQTQKNLKKVIRTNVRLAHSLAADNDLNDLLHEQEKKYQAAVQSGGATNLDLTWLLERVLERTQVLVKKEQTRTAARKSLRA